MTNHAPGEQAARHFADEVRAELARQKKTAGDLARAIGVNPHTAGRRLNGDVPFNVIETVAIERWLALPAGELMRRTEGAKAVAS